MIDLVVVLKRFAAFCIWLTFISIFATSSARAQADIRFKHLDVTSGLVSNHVYAIHQDTKGFIWLGTAAGLVRYDAYSFKVFQPKNDADNKERNVNDVRAIYDGPHDNLIIETGNGFSVYNASLGELDNHIDHFLASLIIKSPITLVRNIGPGIFWFLTEGSVIYTYTESTKTTDTIKPLKNTQQSIYNSPVADIGEAPDGSVWLIHTDGILELLDPKRGLVKKRVDLIKNSIDGEKSAFRLFIDKQGTVWIFDKNRSKGLFVYDPGEGKLQHLSKTSSPIRLNSDIVTGILQVSRDIFWIATDHGGINIYDRKKSSVDYLLHNPDNSASLSLNNISCLFMDRSGMIWAGTFRRGINLYHERLIPFKSIWGSPAVKKMLNNINYIAEDKLNNLWIGTDDKGLICYNRKSQAFKVYQHDPSNSESLSNNTIVGLSVDKKGGIWVGTYFGGLDYFDGRSFKHYRNEKSNSNSLSDNRVGDVFEDSKGRLWVGTIGGGLNMLDKETNKFKRFSSDNGTLSANYVSKVCEDSKGNIWIGTSWGLNLLPRGSSETVSIHSDSKSRNSLIAENINTIYVDSKDLVWVGTQNGLSIFDPASKKFTNFTAKSGLAANDIRGIIEASDHSFWISTSNGLSNISFSGEGHRITTYNKSDGLQDNELGRNTIVRLHDGQIAVGGTNGINLFDPAPIQPLKYAANLRFTNLFIFNKEVEVNDEVEGKVILTRSLSETNSIVLTHLQNVFTIEFSSLNYLKPEKVRYEYMLEGFDKRWNASEYSQRKATYTNLDPGTYVLKVRATDGYGKWLKESLRLEIKVLPPFWLSKWAYAFYLLTVAGILFVVRHNGIEKMKLKFEAERQRIESERRVAEEKQYAKNMLEQERLEAQRARDIDAMKIKFLTHISHEFRTPLSLILAPIDHIERNVSDQSLKQQVQVVKRNGKRLLGLVNQILDFRKMELRELKVNVSKAELVAFVSEIIDSFRGLAGQKKIDLEFYCSYPRLEAYFDQDKIERILFNLLSNAFKFTLQGGKVCVFLDLTADRSGFELKVIDTGIGIAADKQSRVFESFFQADIPNTLINQGTGLGLSIVKEFVQLLNGDILLESAEGTGTIFTVSIPFSNEVEESIDEIAVLDDQVEPVNATSLPAQNNNGLFPKKKTLLIVEDDGDMRFILKDNLKNDFNILEADDGKEGWQKTLFYHPDIILSDVSMPVMNGIELCRKIKEDARTYYIPVILLTALTSEEEQIRGLHIGANDYITKPFSFEVVRSKINNLLIQQDSFKKVYQKQVKVTPADVHVESPDDKFLKELLQNLENNISDSNLTVDGLARMLFMGRVTLYNRIISITGKTPLEFIKSYRLKRAAQLLETGNLTISQVCYRAGFKTQKHFVKLFKEEFGVIPSKYRDNLEQQGN